MANEVSTIKICDVCDIVTEGFVWTRRLWLVLVDLRISEKQSKTDFSLTAAFGS